MNLHENGLRRSVRLQKLQEEEELQKLKAHTTYSTVTETTVAFDVFSLFALASSVTFTEHQTNTNTTFTEQVMNRFHEVDELYNVTLNKIHHLF